MHLDMIRAYRVGLEAAARLQKLSLQRLRAGR